MYRQRLTHETLLMFAVVLVELFTFGSLSNDKTELRKLDWCLYAVIEFGGRGGGDICDFESCRKSCSKFVDMFSRPFTRGWKETPFRKLGAHGLLHETRYL